MTDELLTKTAAIRFVSNETACGKYLVEKKIRELVREGKITLVPDPADTRWTLIRKADLQIIITALIGEW